jgi:hypothetical protein
MGSLMNLDDATYELYGLPPDDFTKARDAKSRDAGDPTLARRLKALRKPTLSAWLANLLVRERSDEIAKFLELGAEMRKAQTNLRGDDLRSLSRDRREIIAVLRNEARAIARERGKSISDAAVGELAATLEAALADESAASTLRAGCLATPLLAGGFDAVSLSPQVAKMPRRQESKRPDGKSRPPAGKGPDRRKAADQFRKAENAQAAASTKHDELDKAEREANRQSDVVKKRLLSLRDELADLESEERNGDRRREAATSALARSTTDLEKKTERVTAAQAVVDRLDRT